MQIATGRAQVNNEVYHALGERWYGAFDDPIALLRAESRLRNPWVLASIRKHFGDAGAAAKVLDVGCGGGFLANYLSEHGLEVVGIDQAESSLAVAQRHDASGRVQYQVADAKRLPFPNQSFDAVCAMDFLEHVEDPMAFVQEMGRVLKPGGMFFFHTFNRNPLAWLVIIKLVEWFVANTPKNLHVLRLFIKPAELAAGCKAAGMQITELHGSKPELWSWAVFKAFWRRRVPENFAFSFTKSTLLAYTGYAVKGNE